MTGTVKCRITGANSCWYAEATQLNHQTRCTLWRLSTAFIIAFCFMVAEIVGGILSGSLAILTDAAHLLTDLGAFAVGIMTTLYSSRPGRGRKSFGLHRAQVLGSLLAVDLNWVAGECMYR